ncbi:MAG: family carboxypeptidase [Ferruginibacter sp.]|nr:family carboxypeptidase [Ferruginibacter sp.]
MKCTSFFLALLLLFVIPVAAQPLQSPADFLGYQLGDKFTPHYRIVQYFENAAKAAPQMMQLEHYGQTYEGRPLLLAYISSPENMTRLEEIRKNNLRLTGMLKDKPAEAGGPAIIWFSYNVHGNEASSSEVSMKTLYKLLGTNNPQTKAWLKNTVIIIDPCLNPDGRDRYVNWYNQVVGATPDPDPEAREHNEPWPGGRTNHYNFDLNRDWAWQTQIETQARLKKYNQWMPQVHCDFHEQMPGNPYYFAPAAEPFHEVITGFQRSFQTTIGKNHARYFDANGWLYFTKEYFDLFYPSYGDTYPLYNGSIGMTYEQAGHGRAGLAIDLDNDDTLRLSDRIAHHFTTSMSTVEAVSNNAAQLMSSFKKYFDDANAGLVGEYKTYIVAGATESKLAELTALFDRNAIQYGYAVKGKPVKAYNFFNGKEENYTLTDRDIVIPTNQPKAVLVKVLFEPSAKLTDSATYDITAWSLPFAYGLQSFATREKLPLSGTAVNTSSPNYQTPVSNYGYLVNYNSFEDGKFLAALLKNDIRVRFAEKEFSYNGVRYAKGSLVILKAGNDAKMNKLLELAKQFNNKITAVSSGFMESGFDFGSDKLHLLKKPKIALVTGNGSSSGAAGEIWHLFEQQLNYPLTLVNAEDVDGTDWKEFDVLIVPDGYYKFLGTKDAAGELRSWVRNGGRLILMENAAAQVAGLEWGIKLKKAEEEKPDDKKDPYTDLKKYEDRERDNIVNNIPGAIYKVELDNSHPLAFGYPSYYYSLKLSDNLYEFSKDGWNVGVIKKEKQVSGFVGNKVKEKIKDGTVIGAMQMGRGQVIYFADDPVFRSFWQNGKLLLTNAVFLVGQ